MVTLGGLGYKFAGWEAAGGIQEASGWYLEAPGRQGSCPGGPQIQRTYPGEGLRLFPGCRIQDHRLQDPRLQGLP